MILNSPLYKARQANPEIQRLISTGGSGKVKLTDSAGTEWTVTVENGQIKNSTMGHPIRNTLIGLASEIPGLYMGSTAPAAIGSTAATGSTGASSAYVGADVASVAAHGAGPTATAFSWGKLAPMLVGGGLQALGSFQQARAANKASQQMVDASNRALDFSKGIYADQKANQTPFIQTGQGALTGLNQMLRIPQPTPSQTPAPQGPLSSLSAPGGMTLMKAPDGSTRLVSASQVPMLQQRGAQVVQ